MLFEYCAENFTNIDAALRAGADRIELCDNLAQGGTTPSAGVIEQAVRIVREHEGAELRVIIRPPQGQFRLHQGRDEGHGDRHPLRRG